MFRAEVNYKNKEYLYHEHIEQKRPIYEIAKECGVSGDTIRRYLQKNGIDYWTTQYREKLSNEEIDDIVRLYCEERLSANRIGQIIGCSHKTVIRVLQKRGIDTRDISTAQFTLLNKEISELYNDKEWLSEMYWQEGKTTTEIARELGVAPSTVLRHIKKLGIQTKSPSEAKQGQLTGERHPNWKGGATPLKRLLREYFRVNQLPQIAKRDNYTCQLCGETHTVLNVHHKRRFSEIIEEIIDENKDIDIESVEGKLKMYDIITNDFRFNDPNNLITYCKNCHYFKIHKYKNLKIISSQASLVEEGSETIPLGSTP